MADRPLSPDVRPLPADDRAVVVEERPRRRRHVAIAVVAALVAAAVALFVARDSDDGSAAEAHVATTTTALVARRDLIQRDTVNGTLGFADESRVVNYATGTITYLPVEGRVLGRGQTLYTVNERPVILFFGAQPAWRSLAEASATGETSYSLSRTCARSATTSRRR